MAVGDGTAAEPRGSALLDLAGGIGEVLNPFCAAGWRPGVNLDGERRRRDSRQAPNKVLWEKTRLMLRSLLAERFKLSIRRETKEMPVYELVVAKGGPKFKKTDQDCDASATACHGFWL
jgi:hypothetical protein